MGRHPSWRVAEPDGALAARLRAKAAPWIGISAGCASPAAGAENTCRTIRRDARPPACRRSRCFGVRHGRTCRSRQGRASAGDCRSHESPRSVAVDAACRPDAHSPCGKCASGRDPTKGRADRRRRAMRCSDELGCRCAFSVRSGDAVEAAPRTLARSVPRRPSRIARRGTMPFPAASSERTDADRTRQTREVDRLLDRRPCVAVKAAFSKELRA